MQVVDSALSSIFNQIDAVTSSAPPLSQNSEEETVPKNRHDLVTVAPQTFVQQPAEERRHHRPLRRQASLSKSAGAVMKMTGLKQNGTVALGQRVSDASAAAAGTVQLTDDAASKIEKSAVVPVPNKKTQERRQQEREGTTTGQKFIAKSLASEDSKYITVSTDAAATDETKDPKKDLQDGEEAKNAKTEKTSSKDGNGYFGSWSGGLFNNKEQHTTFHVYSAVEAETDKIKVGWDSAIEEGRAASKSPHYKFGYFLSISQQAAAADITKNSAVILCIL